MRRIRATELRRRLRQETGEARGTARDRELRSRISDYFITHNHSDGIFLRRLWRFGLETLTRPRSGVYPSAPRFRRHDRGQATIASELAIQGRG